MAFAMMGGGATCSCKYHHFTFSGPPGAVHADKLLKQLDCEVTIFLSDWHVVDAEETGDIDED